MIALWNIHCDSSLNSFGDLKVFLSTSCKMKYHVTKQILKINVQAVTCLSSVNNFYYFVSRWLAWAFAHHGSIKSYLPTQQGNLFVPIDQSGLLSSPVIRCLFAETKNSLENNLPLQYRREKIVWFYKSVQVIEDKITSQGLGPAESVTHLF